MEQVDLSIPAVVFLAGVITGELLSLAVGYVIAYFSLGSESSDIFQPLEWLLDIHSQNPMFISIVFGLGLAIGVHTPEFVDD